MDKISIKIMLAFLQKCLSFKLQLKLMKNTEKCLFKYFGQHLYARSYANEVFTLCVQWFRAIITCYRIQIMFYFSFCCCCCYFRNERRKWYSPKLKIIGNRWPAKGTHHYLGFCLIYMICKFERTTYTPT